MQAFASLAKEFKLTNPLMCIPARELVYINVYKYTTAREYMHINTHT